MDFRWTDEQIEFRDELRAFIKEQRTPELIAELRERRGSEGAGPEAQKFQEALNEVGYTTMWWPEEFGGQDKGAFFLFILKEELGYWGLPYDSLSVLSIGNTIWRFGSEKQKKEWLPNIQSGEMTFALGYSEPNAGSDLASLQTRATRDGDDWVINGQKIYTSSAHISSHIWLAARTDPDQPKHRGISMFVFPMDTPGITVRPLWTMGELRTNETFFENVRIPGDAIVGEENRGWYTAMSALDLERVSLGPWSPLQRTLDDTVHHIRERRPELCSDAVTRATLAQHKLEVEMARALALTNAEMIDSGRTPTMEASMTKVWAAEVAEHLANTSMDLLGAEGALQRASGEYAPIEGALEAKWRNAPVLRFGGGSNDLQRQIIATRGLGLPRG